MRINDGIVHQRSLHATLSEEDLRDILVHAVAAAAEFPYDEQQTKVKFWLTKEPTGSTSQWKAEISLTNDLPIPDEDGETT